VTLSEEILDSLKRRDASAQRKARSALFPAVRAVCGRMLNDPMLAEHTAEDIWTEFLFQHVDRVRSARGVLRYLRLTTVRRCARVREVSARYIDESTIAERISDAPDAIELVASKQQQQRLMSCLQRLTGKVRAVLRMRFAEEMTQEAIGQQTGASKQYVGRVLKQALNRLRRCMGEA